MRLTEAKRRSQDLTNRRSFSLNREMDVALYRYRTSKGFRKEAEAVRSLVKHGLTLLDPSIDANKIPFFVAADDAEIQELGEDVRMVVLDAPTPDDEDFAARCDTFQHYVAGTVLAIHPRPDAGPTEDDYSAFIVARKGDHAIVHDTFMTDLMEIPVLK
jgi:hypothetical protein